MLKRNERKKIPKKKITKHKETEKLKANSKQCSY